MSCATGFASAATDLQMDQLVYQLYGLTPDEIQIVEKATAAKRETTAETDLDVSDET